MAQILANVFVWCCLLSIALLIGVGVHGYHELASSRSCGKPDESKAQRVDFDGVSRLDLILSTRSAMRYDKVVGRSRRLRFVGRSM